MRHRRGGGAGDGGGGRALKGATATALLRPALEAAVVVARAGERAVPVTPAPASLRRYLSFARLPDPALDVARRVLDEDGAFRNRVAGTADEAAVGRPGWLFLHRPDGWQVELDRLFQEAAAAEIAAKDERHERGAQRRLAGAEAALARVESTARSATAQAEAALADLHAERIAARALAEEVDRLRSEIERLSGDRAEVIRRLKAVEATANERSAELRTARHELRMVQAELGQALGGGAAPDAAPAVAPTTAPASGPLAPPPDQAPLDQAPLDRDALAAAVADANEGAVRLWAVLAELTALVGPLEGTHASAEAAVDAEPAAATGARRDRAQPPRRQPTALPPAVFDDGPEAAEHLVRVPRVLVLVDGYNVSQAQWYGLAPSEQRIRLLDACNELHARCSTDIEVVFDGAGDAETTGSLARSSVRYRFTSDGVEADDVLLERAAEEPLDRPIVVVSSDRRVRDGARRRGANVLNARQFLTALHR